MSNWFSTATDEQLMRRARADDDDAFAELVRRYQPPLARVAESRLGRRDWAEDVVQETLLAAYQSRRTFVVGASFRPWLWTILLNQCHRHWRRRTRTPRVEGWTETGAPREAATQHEQALVGRELTPPAELIRRQRDEQLQQMLSQLSAVQADALRLRFFGGLKFREIAEAMGCSLPTAKNRVKWGLLRMAKLLGQPVADWGTADSGEPR